MHLYGLLALIYNYIQLLPRSFFIEQKMIRILLIVYHKLLFMLYYNFGHSHLF